MRSFASSCLFGLVVGTQMNARRWSGHSAGLEDTVKRVFTALEALEKYAGHPVRLEMDSAGRFLLCANTRDAGMTPSPLPHSSLVDCHFETDVHKALKPLLAAERVQSAPGRGRRPKERRDEPLDTAAAPVILDTARLVREDQLAAQFIRLHFPHLELRIDHSTGTDVKGARTHTHTVSLRSRTLSEPLSTEEEDAIERFHGTAVGHGYNRTLVRAMRAACAAIGKPYGSNNSTDEHAAASQFTGQSVLDHYTTLLLSHAPTASLHIHHNHTSSSSSDTTAAQAVHIQVLNQGAVIAEKRCSAHDALPHVLDAVRLACQHVAPADTAELNARIKAQPVVVVLPEQHVSVKKLLLQLLDYHYGLSEDQLVLDTTRAASGLFECTLQLALRLDRWMPTDEAATEIVLPLKRGTGTAKKMACEVACVAVVQELFPDVFAEHLSSHAEMDALVSHSKLADKGLLPPPVSQGLKAQLTWATATAKGHWHCEARRLDEGRDYTDLAVSVHRPTWCAETTVALDGGSAADKSEDRAVLLSASPPSRTVLAFDSRKSRAEQKSLARALALFFPDVCREAVAHAVALSLLAPDGTLLPCPGVEVLPSDDDFREAANCDVHLAALRGSAVPFETVLSAGANGTDGAVSLLELCEAELSRASSSPSTPPSSTAPPLLWHVDVRFDEEKARFVATGSLQSSAVENIDADSHAVCYRASHWSMWAARLAVCRECVDHDVRAKAAAVQRVSDVTRALPSSLSRTEPLMQTIDAVRSLYGVSVVMRAYTVEKVPQQQPVSSTESHTDAATTGKVCVELWGVTGQTGLESTAAAGESTQRLLQRGREALLARATASSLLGAVVKCCRLVMVYHIRPVREVFPKTLVHNETIRISAWDGDETATLPRLLSRVRDDVRQSATSDAGEQAADGTVPFAACVDAVVATTGTLAHVLFKVQSTTAAVTLETVTDADLLAALAELEQRVGAELGACAQAHHKERSTTTFNTFEDALRSAVNNRFGLATCVDTHDDGGRWHCEISVNLGGGVFYSLACATATRKTDAVELAASFVLDTSLARGTRADKSRILGSSINSTDATGEAEKTGCFFRRTV